MKKTYISPKQNVVKINMSSPILNGSPIPIDSTGSPIDAGGAAAPELFGGMPDMIEFNLLDE